MGSINTNTGHILLNMPCEFEYSEVRCKKDRTFPGKKSESVIKHECIK